MSVTILEKLTTASWDVSLAPDAVSALDLAAGPNQ